MLAILPKFGCKLNTVDWNWFNLKGSIKSTLNTLWSYSLDTAFFITTIGFVNVFVSNIFSSKNLEKAFRTTKPLEIKLELNFLVSKSFGKTSFKAI